VNNDNKISFEEFFNWWYYGKTNKLEALVIAKMKSMKMLEKAKAKLDKAGGILE